MVEAECYKEHQSIMLNEVLSFLCAEIPEEQSFLMADLTFGGGGHSFALLKEFPKSHLLATDQDLEAYQNGLQQIKKIGLDQRTELYHANFKEMVEICKQSVFFHQFKGFKSILLDIGVSTHHFFSEERGFSYKLKGPLDMRMDKNISSLQAKDVVNTFSEEEIVDILEKYGEERFAKQIAKKVVEERQKTEINFTDQLENLVFHCYPKKYRYGRTHPATKTFQALRIYINQELEVLEESIPKLFDLLLPGGLLLIITFHSLEDRIVKHKFKQLHRQEQLGIILTKKPIIPQKDEILNNKKARSAKLRVIKKN